MKEYIKEEEQKERVKHSKKTINKNKHKLFKKMKIKQTVRLDQPDTFLFVYPESHIIT